MEEFHPAKGRLQKTPPKAANGMSKSQYEYSLSDGPPKDAPNTGKMKVPKEAGMR